MFSAEAHVSPTQKLRAWMDGNRNRPVVHVEPFQSGSSYLVLTVAGHEVVNGMVIQEQTAQLNFIKDGAQSWYIRPMSKDVIEEFQPVDTSRVRKNLFVNSVVFDGERVLVRASREGYDVEIRKNSQIQKAVENSPGKTVFFSRPCVGCSLRLTDKDGPTDWIPLSAVGVSPPPVFTHLQLIVEDLQFMVNNNKTGIKDPYEILVVEGINVTAEASFRQHMETMKGITCDNCLVYARANSALGTTTFSQGMKPKIFNDNMHKNWTVEITSDSIALNWDYKGTERVDYRTEYYVIGQEHYTSTSNLPKRRYRLPIWSYEPCAEYAFDLVELGRRKAPNRGRKLILTGPKVKITPQYVGEWMRIFYSVPRADYADYEISMDRYGTSNVTSLQLENSFSQATLKTDACFDHTVFLTKNATLVHNVTTNQPSSAPSKPIQPPTVTSNISNEIRVIWTYDNQSLCDVTGFKILYNPSDKPDEVRELKIDGANSSEIVLKEDIDSCRTYDVKLAALNSIGSSPASDAQTVYVVAAPSKPIQPPTVTSNISNEIRVSWTYDNQSLCDVTGFKILYNPSDKPDEVRELKIDGANSSEIVLKEDIDSCRTYDVKLAALNSIGSSPASDAQTVYVVAAPSKPIQPPTVTSNISNEIRVIWTYDNQSLCDVTGFKILYNPSDKPDEVRELKIDGANSSEIVLKEDIDSCRTYDVKLAALNSIGSSPASDAQTVYVVAAPSKPIQPPTVTSNISNEIRVIWTYDNQSLCDVTGFKILYNPSDKPDEVRELKIDGANSSEIVLKEDIDSCRTYDVKLAALNSIGSSPASDAQTVYVVAAPSKPIQPPTVTSNISNEIRVIWTYDNQSLCDVTGFKILYNPSDKPDEVRELKIDGANSSEIVLKEDIDSCRTYDVKLAALNSIGSSPASDAQTVYVVAAPSKPIQPPTVTSNISNEIRVIWTYDNQSLCDVTGFKILYNPSDKPDEVRELKIDGANSSEIVLKEDIDSCRTYDVKLAALNSIGSSPASDAQTVYVVAAPSKPIQPPTVTSNISNEIRVSWTYDNQSLCDVTGFKILYNPSDKPDEVRELKIDGANSSEIVLKEDIDSCRTYDVKLAALNSIGSSPASDAQTVYVVAAPPKPIQPPTVTSNISNEIRVIWTYDNQSLCDVTGFKILYNPSDKPDEVRELKIDGANSSEIVLKEDIDSCRTYDVKLAALNSIGSSPASDAQTVYVVAAPSKPIQPPTVTSNISNEIRVIWTYDNQSLCDVTGFKILYNPSDKPDEVRELKIDGANSSEIVLKEDIDSCRTYDVKLAALNSIGSSPASDAQTVYVVAAPSKPIQPPTVTSNISNEIRVSWTYDNQSLCDVTGFKILYNPSDKPDEVRELKIDGANSSEIVLKEDIDSCRTYDVKLAALNSIGSSPASDAQTVYVVAAPSKPIQPPTVTSNISNEIRVIWTYDNQSLCDVTGFKILYNPSDKPDEVRELKIDGANSSEIVLKEDIDSCRTYDVKLAALNSIGSSPASDAQTVYVVAAPSKPIQPPTVTSNISNEIRVSWTYDNQSLCDVTGFKILYNPSDKPDEVRELKIDGANSSEIVLKEDIDSCRTYDVKLAALNSIGSSPASDAQTVYVVAAPSKPIQPPTVTSNISNEIRVSWTYDNQSLCDVTGFKILYNPSDKPDEVRELKIDGANSSEIVLKEDIDSCRTYDVKLAALNSIGSSPASDAQTVYVVAAPSKPIQPPTVTSNISNEIRVIWTYDNQSLYDVTGFKILYNPSDKPDEVRELKIDGANSSEIVLKEDIDSCRTYDVKLAALNSIGSSPASDAQTVYVVAAPSKPIQPPTVTSNISNEIRVSWTYDNQSLCDVTGFKILYNPSDKPDEVRELKIDGANSSEIVLKEDIDSCRTYDVKLAALNSIGSSPASDAQTVYVVAAPSKPIQPPTVTSNISNEIRVSWTYDNQSLCDVTGFKILYNPSDKPDEVRELKIDGANSSEIVLKEDIDSCRTYDVKLAALNSIGSSPASDAQTVYVVAAPSKPIQPPTVTSNISNEIRVSWTYDNQSLCDVTGFKILYNPSDKPDEVRELKIDGANSSEIVLKEDIDSCRTYDVKLAALNSIGSSPASDAQTVYVVAAPSKPIQPPTVTSNISNEIRVSWTYDNQSLCDVTGFKILYNPSDKPDEVRELKIDGANSSEIVLKEDIDSCRTYDVKLAALNSIGSSPASDAQTVYVVAAPSKPIQPLTVTSNISNEIRVSWTYDNQSLCDVTGFKILYNPSDKPDEVRELKIDGANSSEIVLKEDIDSCRTYDVKLAALNSIGSSPASDAQTVYVVAAPSKPIQPPTVTSNISNEIRVSWTYDNQSLCDVTGFKILYNPSDKPDEVRELKIDGANSSEIVLKEDIDSCRTYDVKLAALNSIGSSPASDAQTVYVVAAPSKPIQPPTVTSNISNEIRVSWTYDNQSLCDVTGFKILYNPSDKPDEMRELKIDGANSSEIVLKEDIDSCRTYDVKLAALNSIGSSPASDAQTVYVVAAPSKPIQPLTVTSNISNEIRVSWTYDNQSLCDVTGFKILYNPSDKPDEVRELKIDGANSSEIVLKEDIDSCRTYDVKLAALNSIGSSPASDAQTVYVVAAPSKPIQPPTVTSNISNEIRVSWTYDNQSLCDVTGFKILYNPSDKPDEMRELKIDGANSSEIVLKEDIDSCRTYDVKLAALNSIGSSPASDAQTVYVVAAPSKPIQPLTVTSNISNEIRVSWTYDNQSLCDVTGFKILYNPSDKPDEVRELKIDGANSSEIVLKEDIDSCRTYDVKLAALNSIGSSPASDAQTVYVVAAPSKPIQPPTVTSNISNEIRVSWTYDNQSLCDVTGFKILYNPSDKPDEVRELKIDGANSSEIVLKEDIDSCRTYDVKLAALNSIGSSPASDAQTVYVVAAPSKPIQPPTVTSNISNEIRVSWTYDNQSLCDVTGFKILYNPSDKPDEVRELKIDGANSSEIVLKEDIDSCRTYDVRFSAVNSFGSGVLSDSRLLDVYAVPPVVTDIKPGLDTPDSIFLKWRYERSAHCVAKFFRIFYNAPGGPSHVVETGNTSIFLKEGVSSCNTYNLRVGAVDPSEGVHLSVWRSVYVPGPPILKDVRRFSVGKHMIHFETAAGCRRPDNYTLALRDPSGQIHWYPLHGSTKRVIVEGLCEQCNFTLVPNFEESNGYPMSGQISANYAGEVRANESKKQRNS
ncbi:unnamed protein product [Calicophoron daubneyi]|uniref:Fibronectin type-III domain-containing protein n=1 Tax=Calicophoron daubneyi TaxID=300641 RepID=A0AAV2T914_CALDB